MAFDGAGLVDAGFERLALELRDAERPFLADRDDVVLTVVLGGDRFESAHQQARRVQHVSGRAGLAGGGASGVARTSAPTSMIGRASCMAEVGPAA